MRGGKTASKRYSSCETLEDLFGGEGGRGGVGGGVLRRRGKRTGGEEIGWQWPSRGEREMSGWCYEKCLVLKRGREVR